MTAHVWPGDALREAATRLKLDVSIASDRVSRAQERLSDAESKRDALQNDLEQLEREIGGAR